jgi:hypothetical protein
MTRRIFFGSAGLATLAGAQTQPDQRALIELTYIRMRNTKDNQRQRTTDFVSQQVAPAMKRAGSGPVGLFTISIGEGSPSLMILTSYPSLAAYQGTLDKLAADAQLNEAATAYYSNPLLSFQRVEKTLLRAFHSAPDIEVPPTDADRPARVFEMRNYESDNFMTLARKVDMFNRGEVEAFRRSNMQPVFLGETIVGARMPNLIYMLAYDNMAARDTVWAAFSKDPGWQKLRAEPGLTDNDIVSNINTTYLRPAAGSDIR